MSNATNLEIVKVNDERTAGDKITCVYNLETGKTTAYINPNGDIKEQLERVNNELGKRALI